MEQRSSVMPSYMLLAVAIFHLVCITNAVVYYVTPDDHYSTGSNTVTLQHCLNNTSKYFTSNSQLLLQPGHYYLNANIIIQNINYFSFTGSRTDGSLNTVITCTSPAGIVVTNSSNIIIANMKMRECKNHFTTVYDVFHVYVQSKRFCLLTIHCWNITVMYFEIHSKTLGKLSFLNALGHSLLESLMSNELIIFNTRSIGVNKTEHNIVIKNFINPQAISSHHSISIYHFMTENVNTLLVNTVFSNKKAVMLYWFECGGGNNTFTIYNCSFTNMYEPQKSTSIGTIFAKMDDCSHDNAIKLVDCYFGNSVHSMKEHFVLIELYNSDISIPQIESLNFTVSIINSVFYKFTVGYMINISNFGNSNQFQPLLLIKNSTFSYISSKFIILLYQVNILLEGPVIFTCIPKSLIIICTNTKVNITFIDYIEFSNNTVYSAIQAAYVYIEVNAVINFYSNTLTFAISKPFQTQLLIIENRVMDTAMQPCIFQYVTEQGSFDTKFLHGTKLNYSILFIQNNALSLFEARYSVSHCKWNNATAFTYANPTGVNEKVIEYVNNTEEDILTTKIFCVCNSSQEYNCHLDKLGPFYPGQTATFKFIIFGSDVMSRSNKIDIVRAKIDDKEDIACKSNNGSNFVNLFTNQCTSFKYQLSHKRKRCELVFKILPKYEAIELLYFRSQVNIFTVTLLPCPKGFEFLELQGLCQCDSALKPLVTDCNINDQTIMRPANSWVLATTLNNSHTYSVSSECPFDFCLPYSSRLNLVTPDSQCQYNRAGALCGQCRQGLSTVFASSQCKRCSNISLLLTVLIAVSGIALVILLFLLNLTVTNGNINAFLLYVNVISINASSFFSTHKSIHYMYVLISLANLDLGIESCFYNGMTDYIKIWLQLAFPTYLIIIAVMLIITSRYFSTVQKLTAQRALPVLATLFLLSYTKVLLTVSSVLFFYSTTTHLPSHHTTLVWPVDTSIPLFGVKFTILFIVCFILFVVLLLFNIILIFARLLSRYRYINYFKPLLDSYQGPYKDGFYYWTGLQLLLRAGFFVLSGLDKGTSLSIGSLLLGAVIVLHVLLQPHRSDTNNKLEVLFLLNIQGIYITNISKTATVFTLVLIVLAFVQLTYVLLHQVMTTHFCLERVGILKYFNKRKACQPRAIELVNPIPEVAFNYRQFRDNEPLSLGD